MSVSYEWTIEVIDQHGDIVESDFEETLSFAKRTRDRIVNDQPEMTVRIALVRDTFNDRTDSVIDRSWAYLGADDKFIGLNFQDAHGDDTRFAIPARFLKESIDGISR